jgi:tRNA-binding EMAP/Myf-like protein
LTVFFFSRYCLWIIGEGKNLIASEDLWKKLIGYAKNLHCVATLNSNVLSKVTSQLNDRDKDIPTASALPNKVAKENVMHTKENILIN